MLAGTLKTAHVFVALLMIAGFTQAIFKSGSNLERVVLAGGLGLLFAIVMVSTGVSKKSWPWRVLVSLHVSWLACFAWFGWFSDNAPFKLYELVNVDFNDPSSITRAEQTHLYRSLALFLFVAFLSSVPLLLKAWRAPNERSSAPGQSAKVMVVISALLFLFVVIQAWMTGADSSYGDSVIVASFLFSLLLSGIAASRGSVMGLSVAVGEAMLPAFLAILIGR